MNVKKPSKDTTTLNYPFQTKKSRRLTLGNTKITTPTNLSSEQQYEQKDQHAFAALIDDLQ